MLETSRLLIHDWQETHAETFLRLSRDEGFTLFPITDYRQTDLSSSLKWIQQMRLQNQTTGLGKWAVTLKETQLIIGMGGLTPWSYEGEEMIDITYRLHREAWGKGLGQELASALVDRGFKVKGLNEITATITPDNLPSKKIAARLGMQFDRRILLFNIPTDLYRLAKRYLAPFGGYSSQTR